MLCYGFQVEVVTIMHDSVKGCWACAIHLGEQEWADAAELLTVIHHVTRLKVFW